MKTAIVIGSTGGIGSALSTALKNDGYTVLGVSKTAEITCDLTDVKQIQKAVGEIKAKVTTIDLLINAAGIANYTNLSAMSDDKMIETMMVNAIAPAIFVRELAPLMQNPDSLVISLGSGAGTIPMRGRSVYCASKFALRGLSLSLTEEYKEALPHFCLITLGSTLTNFGPLTVAEKQKEFENGRAYFPVDFVVNKLMEIIHDPKRESEIVLFPGDHGFGEWKKP